MKITKGESINLVLVHFWRTSNNDNWNIEGFTDFSFSLIILPSLCERLQRKGVEA